MAAGDELGNHSQRHHYDLARRSPAEVAREIGECDERHDLPRGGPFDQIGEQQQRVCGAGEADGALEAVSEFNTKFKPLRENLQGVVAKYEDNAEFFTADGPGTLTRYASCVRKRGCVTAFHGWTDVHDAVVENWIGVAMQAVTEDGTSALNMLFTGNRYTTGVAGWADVTGGANLSVTIPSAGQMRVDATASMSMDFAAGFAELVGTSYWGVQVGGFPSGGNNGTFAVLSTGAAAASTFKTTGSFRRTFGERRSEAGFFEMTPVFSR